MNHSSETPVSPNAQTTAVKIKLCSWLCRSCVLPLSGRSSLLQRTAVPAEKCGSLTPFFFVGAPCGFMHLKTQCIFNVWHRINGTSAKEQQFCLRVGECVQLACISSERNDISELRPRSPRCDLSCNLTVPNHMTSCTPFSAMELFKLLQLVS